MKDETLIVERVEDSVVTIEKSENEFYNISISEIGFDVHEGDVLKSSKPGIWDRLKQGC